MYNFNLRKKHHKISLNDFIDSNSDNGFIYSVFRSKNPITQELNLAWQQVEAGERKIESCAQLTNFLLEASGVQLNATNLLSGRDLKDEAFGRFLETISEDIIHIEQEKYFPQSILDSKNLIQVQGLIGEELDTFKNISFWLHAGNTRRIAKKFFLSSLKLSPLPKNFDYAFRGYLIFQYRLQLFKDFLEN